MRPRRWRGSWSRRGWPSRAPLLLLAAGSVLLVADGVLALATRHPARVRTVTVTVTAQPPATTTTAPATTAPTTTAPATTTAPTTTATAPPAPVAMSWDDAGGLVVNTSGIDPILLGQSMRSAGFGWVAVLLGGPGPLVPPDPSWIDRFRSASGLPVGGWSVLGGDPAGEAKAAAALVAQDGLAFYIADAEAPYGYTEGATESGTRYGRSQQFVAAFRAAEPTLPAGVSSYCRPDEHDLDWSAWAGAGFVFLPQAYVNQFGATADPAACVQGAAKWFPASDVHPTVPSYAGTTGFLAPSELAALLAASHTTGFSIYPAEVGMSAQDWQAYGQAIASLHIARAVP